MPPEMWNLLSGLAVIGLMCLIACFALIRTCAEYRKAVGESKRNQSRDRFPIREMPSGSRQRIVSVPSIEVTRPPEDTDIIESVRTISKYLEKPPSYEDLEPPPYDVAVHH